MNKLEKLHTEVKKLEERIALQAEEIKQLRQENEQLRAKLEEWKYEVKCHMDEVVARDKEIGKLRNVIEEIKDNLHAINCVREMPDKVEMYANEAISIIDEMGGKEDV
jgi:predicted RNase H-like nuclease (RuvC/YqgF family)